MIDALLQNGTEIASELRSPSDQRTPVRVKTTGDLLELLAEKPQRSFSMLKSTCGLLGVYLDLPGNEIPIDILDARRKGFRTFLASRRYSENSVRSYVYQLRVLLKTARRFGWRPDANAPERWQPLLAIASAKKIMDIVQYFSRITKTPADVTAEDVEHWYKEVTEGGMLFTTASAKRNAFWRLLRDTGWTAYNPPYLIKLNKYGISLDQLPPELSAEIQAALKWKTSEFSKGRPKWGKIRAVSANNLRLGLCQLAGYAIGVCGLQLVSLSELVQKDIVESYVEWSINERGTKGLSLQSRLGMIAAVMNHHPAYASLDFSWLKTLIDSVPLEDDSERKQRKSQKYVEYQFLETIPEKIRAVREAYEKRRKKNAKRTARLAQDELMMRWLLVLPWRQRNLRECRIAGTTPNLFKGKITPFSELERPGWVIAEEERNPNAEFWQVRFAAKETKTGLAIHLLLPRQLIGPLEEFLEKYRPILLDGKRTETLFLNQNGKPVRADLIDKVIGHWSLQFTGVRTTPHLFRDSVAYAWLKAYPRDYLSVSKHLWHRNLETTVSIYASRYNASSAACAMEVWLDERVAEAKAQ